MKKAVGLDIRKDGWTAVELKLSGNQPEIIAVRGGEWDTATDPVSRGKLLDKAFSSYGINKRKVVSSLPSETIHWQRRTFPALDRSSLQAAVRTDLEGEVPWPETEWGFSFREWKTGGQKVEVEAFAFPQHAVDEQLLMLKTAAFKRSYFLPRICGIINYFYFYRRFFPLAHDKTLFIETTPAATEIFLLGQQGVLHLRTFPNPLNAEGRYDLQALAGELKITRFHLRKAAPEDPPKSCYLLGFTGLGKDALALIAEPLGIAAEEVRIFPQQETLFRRQDIDYSYPGFFSATGLALEGLGLVRSDLSFLHSRTERTTDKRALWTFGLLTAGLLFALGGVILRHDLRRKEEAFLHSWLQETQEETAEIRNLLDEQIALEEKLTYYSALQKNQLVILDFLAEWERVAPPNTKITALVLDGQQVTRLSGTTPSFTVLYQAILDSPYLKNLQVREGITLDQEGLEVFHLSGLLGGEDSID